MKNNPYPVGPGWWPLLDRARAIALSIDPDAKIVCKEKYGACQAEVLYNALNYGVIGKLEDDIEDMTQRICENCGEDASVKPVPETPYCARCYGLPTAERFAVREETKKKYYHSTYDVGEGWWPLLDERMPALRELLPDTEFYIKEKFGRCRVQFFLLTEDKDLLEKAWRIASEIEAESGKICERCGRPGKLRTDRSWRRTLCDQCAEK